MKKILTMIVVGIVILSMAAGYLLSGLEIQPSQPEPQFIGPTGEPSVQGPSSAPSVTGPTNLPPQ